MVFDHINGWEAEIWDGITDSDGNSITTEDVKFSYENESSQGLNRYSKNIENIEIIDDTHMVFTINSNVVNGINTFFDVAIVSQKAFEESSDEMAARPVGTGPYVITDYVEGASLVSYYRLSEISNVL